MESIMHPNYEHLLAFDYDNGIRANVVYTEIDSIYLGCYFGYEGGGAYSSGFFLVDEDYEVQLDWDLSSFPENYQKILSKLEAIRATFEDDDIDNEGNLSEIGNDLAINDMTNEYIEHWEYWSENFDQYLIQVISAQWALSMHWNGD